MNFKLFCSKIRNYLYFYGKTKTLKKNRGDKRIIYFGIPMHVNLGDQAQKYCIRKWLKENYPEYEVLEIPTRIVVDEKFKFLPVMKKNIRKSDLIVFQSGYCTHDLEPSKEDLMHRIIIENFSENKMLMLPQTVFFQRQERKNLTSRIYSMAKNMLFLARDKVSYDMACGMFPKMKIELYPDIVTTLIGTKSFNIRREGVFLCTRRDCEKYYSDEELDWLKNKLSDRCNITCGDTSIKCDPFWLDKNLEMKLNDIFEEYASYKVIITDRYHGTIFSLIAETPVIVVKTKDHKVSTGVDWFKGIYDYVYFVDTLEDAYNKAIEILDSNKKCKSKPYFKEQYYDGLKKVFEESVR